MGMCTKDFPGFPGLFRNSCSLQPPAPITTPGEPLQAPQLSSLALPSSLLGKIFHGKVAFRLLKSVAEPPASVETEAQICYGFWEILGSAS